jgi:DNA polymerase-3 subunit delta
MRLRPDQLAGHFRKSLASIYLVYGEEWLIAQEAADAIRTAARARGHDERECLTVATGFDWSALRQLAASPSLFANRRLLELRLGEVKPGEAGSKALVDYIGHPADDAVLLISAGKLDWQMQKSRWFTALDESGVLVPAAAVELRQLPAGLKSGSRRGG